MTIRHFRIFVTAADTGNISKTAEKFCVTPPAVSAVIQELEAHYGVRLFEGTSQNLKITGEGKRLKKYADQLIGLYGDDEQAFQESEIRGILRAGVSVNVGIYHMPPLVREFNRKYPNVTVQMKIGTADTVEKMVMEHQVDLAVIGRKIRRNQLHVTELFVENLIAVCAADHRLAGHTVTLREFVEEPLLFREKSSGAFEAFREAISPTGCTAQPAWESTSTEALLDAVRYGLGVAILPEKLASAEIRRGSLSRIRISDFDFRNNVCLVYHKNKYLSVAMRRFIEMIKKGLE